MAAEKEKTLCKVAPSKGVFITFEGGDGVGKSTHIRFLTKILTQHHLEVVSLREPGGTKIGEKLRRIVLDPQNFNLCDECELLVFEAARAQIVSEVIQPALDRGAVVLCDRFTDSTIAYQAYGRGLSLDFVKRANEFACKGIKPHRTILLTTGGSASGNLRRATQHGADRLERSGMRFHERVNAGFEYIAQHDAQRVVTITSAGKRSETAKAICRALQDVFPWLQQEIAQNERMFKQLDRARRPQSSQRKKREA